MRTAPLLVLLAGCPRGGAGPEPVANQPVDVPTVAEHADPCPVDLRPVAVRAWGVPDDDGWVGASCVALWTGRETLWYLDGAHRDVIHEVLVTPAGEVTWSSSSDGHNASTLEWWVSVRELEAADVDGDGDDELLHVDVCCGHGEDAERRLQVARVTADRGLDRRGVGLVISFHEAQTGRTCDGQWRVVGQRIEVTRSGPDCAPPGRSLYRVQDDRFYTVGE